MHGTIGQYIGQELAHHLLGAFIRESFKIRQTRLHRRRQRWIEPHSQRALGVVQRRRQRHHFGARAFLRQITRCADHLRRAPAVDLEAAIRRCAQTRFGRVSILAVFRLHRKDQVGLRSIGHTHRPVGANFALRRNRHRLRQRDTDTPDTLDATDTLSSQRHLGLLRRVRVVVHHRAQLHHIVDDQEARRNWANQQGLGCHDIDGGFAHPRLPIHADRTHDPGGQVIGQRDANAGFAFGVGRNRRRPEGSVGKVLPDLWCRQLLGCSNCAMVSSFGLRCGGWGSGRGCAQCLPSHTIRCSQ